MAKKSKTAAPVAAAAPAKAEKPKVEAAAAPAAAADNTVVEANTNSFADLLRKLNDVTSLLASVKQEARALEKRLTRELRVTQKLAQKKKSGKGNYKNHKPNYGFRFFYPII